MDITIQLLYRQNNFIPFIYGKNFSYIYLMGYFQEFHEKLLLPDYSTCSQMDFVDWFHLQHMLHFTGETGGRNHDAISVVVVLVGCVALTAMVAAYAVNRRRTSRFLPTSWTSVEIAQMENCNMNSHECGQPTYMFPNAGWSHCVTLLCDRQLLCSHTQYSSVLHA